MLENVKSHVGIVVGSFGEMFDGIDGNLGNHVEILWAQIGLIMRTRWTAVGIGFGLLWGVTLACDGGLVGPF
jgi:hypothetical protein